MRLRTRLLAFPLIAGLAATLSLAPTAQAETLDETRATSAFTWLAKQNTPDGVLASFGTTPDPGLTLDAVLGGVAAGAPRATLDGWLKAVEPGFKNRVMYNDGFGRPVQDTGLIAKAMVALDASGWNTSSYGGINPQKLVLDSFSQGAEPGWAGSPHHTDQVNAFGQGYAMLGAARQRTLPTSAVTFLTRHQCADGGFPMYFDAAGCDSDTDGTALLVMALRAAKAQGLTSADGPLTRATTWLAGQQRANGSFVGGITSSDVENTNSTGLVAAALSDIRPDTVAKARAFVGTLQVTSGPEVGAIALEAKGFKDGIRDLGRGVWVRATAQGLLAFAPVSFHVADVTRSAPYTLPGLHRVGGREWRTTCEPYSRTERCRTEIQAAVVKRVGNVYTIERGWAFNNLTYLPEMPRSAWAGNPLGGYGRANFNGTFTGTDGAQWRTECDSPATGRNACRSFRLTTVYAATPRSAGGYSFSQANQWVLNNIVLFG